MKIPFSVHIGYNYAGSAQPTTSGYIGVYDANKSPITVTTGAINGTPDLSTIYIGNAKNDGTVNWSNPIRVKNVNLVQVSPYIAPEEKKVTLDFSGATINVGEEYVLRIVYKDIIDHPGQFTQTYRVIAKDNTPANLATAFMNAIMKGDPYAIHSDTNRVIATVSSSTLTLEGRPRTDSDKLYSINDYEQVNFEVSTWTTLGAASKWSDYVGYGVVISIAKRPKPGKGEWKLVRDREKASVGYKGGLNALAYPAADGTTLWHDFLTKAGADYNSIIINSDEPYTSLTAQYPETAPIQTEIYIQPDSDTNKVLEVLSKVMPNVNVLKTDSAGKVTKPASFPTSI